MLTVPVWAQSADEKETTESNAVRQDLAGLKYDHSLELQYADQFSVDYYEDGYALITIAGDGQFLLVPEGKEAPDRKSTRLNSSHSAKSRMPSSA